jgi:hypothetical protein
VDDHMVPIYPLDDYKVAETLQNLRV